MASPLPLSRATSPVEGTSTVSSSSNNRVISPQPKRKAAAVLPPSALTLGKDLSQVEQHSVIQAHTLFIAASKAGNLPLKKGGINTLTDGNILYKASGAHAKVYLVTSRPSRAARDGSAHIFKVMQSGIRSYDQRGFIKEEQRLRELDHKNIIRFLGSDMSSKFTNKCIILEDLGSSLDSVMEDHGWRPDEKTARTVFHDSCAGLSYLHSNKLIHCDISPRNIVGSLETGWKLIDLGLSLGTEEEKKQKLLLGSYEYMAPEICKKSTNHSTAVDITAAGLIMMELTDMRNQWNTSGCFTFCESEENDIATIVDPKDVYDYFKEKKALGRKVLEITGQDFKTYMGSSSLPLPEKLNERSWRTKYAVIALAMIRENPAMRPSAQNICEHLDKLNSGPSVVHPVSEKL